VTTHGQPAVAHNDNSRSAGPATDGPRTVATTAPTPPATAPDEESTTAAQADDATPAVAPEAAIAADSTAQPDSTQPDSTAQPGPVQSKPAPEPRAAPETETRTEPASETEPPSKPIPEPGPGTKPALEPETASKPALDAGPRTKPAPETETAPEAQAEREPDPDPEPDPGAAEPQPEAQAEPQIAEPAPDAAPEPPAEPVADEPIAAEPIAAEPIAAEPIAAEPVIPEFLVVRRAGDELAVPGRIGDLAFALRRLRTAIGETTYPLVLPTAEDARRTGAAVVGQLDDYLLPRLARLDAPLLVVVGGSTGAGKSTLVNSLVRAPVSPAGVLRPTTRAPVLVCHPDDTAWFRQGRLLPGLTRTTHATDDPHTLRLVAAPALTPGLALVDAPDIDSVVSTNRELAAQLLSAADLWLFVTTAARYADAVPWDLLQTAAYRGTVVALVLDRVPPEAATEVVPHLTELLGAHQFSGVPLFVLPETGVDGQGLLAEPVVAPIGQWLSGLAADATARSAVVRQTVNGALAVIEPIVDALAEAAEDQASATISLTDRAGAAYRTARRKVDSGLRDGTLLRGEVLARWQEFVGTGELMRALEARIGRARDRVVAALSGRPAPGTHLRTALESGLVALIRAAAAEGAEQAYTGWQAHPSGAALLRPELGRPSADLPERVERLVRDWQRGLLDLVRAEAGDRRATARGAAYAVNATGLLVMVGVFTTTAFIPTGLEVAVAGGTTVAAQKVLEAVFGDQAIRTLARKARDDLLARVDTLLDAEAGRFLRLLPTLGLDLPPAQRLRETAEQVERARRRAALTAGAGPVELALPAQAQPLPETSEELR
jgi:hypothetical protein